MGDSGTFNQRLAGGPPRFFALTTLPTGTMLVGSCARGIARSRDGGRTWAPVSEFPGGSVNAFACSPRGAVLAATSAGLLRSSDDGGTWERAPAPVGCIYAVCAWGDEVLLGTEAHGILRSPDGGRSWEPSPGSPDVTVYRLLRLRRGTLLAATDGAGVWASDGSDRWRHGGLGDATVFGLTATSSGMVLAGTRGDGIHRSADDGATWIASSEGLADPVVHTLISTPDGLVLAGTGDGVARSEDGGTTWTPFGSEVAHHRIFSLAIAPDGALLAGSYERVWARDHTAGRWHAVETGLTPDEAYAVHVMPDGGVLAGTTAGVLKSDDAGATWVHTGVGGRGNAAYTVLVTSDGNAVAGTDDGVVAVAGRLGTALGLRGRRVYCLLEPEPGRLLAGTLGDGLFRLDAPGARWERSSDGLEHPLVFDLLRSSSRGRALAATGAVADGLKTGGIFWSDDRGRRWWPAALEPVTVYALVETTSGVLFAGAQRCRILRSTDGGETWEVCPPPLDHEAKLYCLALDDRDRLYLGAGAELLRSDDGAEAWYAVGAGLDGVTVYDVACHRAGVLLAATSSGLYRSDDGGTTWQPAEARVTIEETTGVR